MKTIVFSVFSFFFFFTFGCVNRLPLENRPCPCTAGWQCCDNMNICVSAGESCPTPFGASELSIDPASATVATEREQKFSASAEVTWSVLEPNGGTISEAGTYTAPEAPGTYHVVATVRGLAPVNAAVTVRPLRVDLVAGALGGPGSLDGVGADVRFSDIRDLTADGEGNLYVIDGYTIRKVVLATGAVSSVAGFPDWVPSRDGIGNQARFLNAARIVYYQGALYVSDRSAIRRVDIANGEVTTFAGSLSESWDSGRDTDSTARFSNVVGLALDGAGALFASDQYTCTIRKIDLATGQVMAVVGSSKICAAPMAGVKSGGTLATARLQWPTDLQYLKCDAYCRSVTPRFGAEMLFVLDWSGLLEIDLATGAVSYNRENSPTYSLERLFADGSVAANGGKLLLSYLSSGRLHLPAASGDFRALFRFAGGEPITSDGLTLRRGAIFAGANAQLGSVNGGISVARLSRPSQVFAEAPDRLLVFDNSGGRRFDLASGMVNQVFTSSELHAEAYDGHGRVYAHSTSHYADVVSFDLNSGLTTSVAAKHEVNGMAVQDYSAADGLGHLFQLVTDIPEPNPITLGVDHIRKIDLTSGEDAIIFTAPAILGFTVDSSGSCWLLSSDVNYKDYRVASGHLSVVKIDPLAGTTEVTGGWNWPGARDGGSGEAAFGVGDQLRLSVASDERGHFYVADVDNHALRRIDLATGQVKTVLGSRERWGVRLGDRELASLNHPRGLSILSNGDVLLTDRMENAILIVH